MPSVLRVQEVRLPEQADQAGTLIAESAKAGRLPKKSNGRPEESSVLLGARLWVYLWRNLTHR